MNRSAHLTGLGTMLVFHMILGGFLIAKTDVSCGGGLATVPEEEPIVIEASLAFKGKKFRQPQKKKKKKFKPDDAQRVARDETAPPPEPKKEDKKKLKPKPDEVDHKSVLDKFRPQDDDAGETGNTEREGDDSSDASEWGTVRDAVGDPYVALLDSHIRVAWAPPSLARTGESVLACVRLDKDGKIVDRKVRNKSSNATLNRSAEIAVKKALDMEEPVPEELVGLLVRRGICFNLQPE